MKRVLTAVALIPVVTYVVLFAPIAVFLAVLAAVTFLCWREYDAIAASYGFGRPGWLACAAGYAWFAWPGDSLFYLVGVALITFAIAMRVSDLGHSLPRSALAIAGIVYIFGTWKCAMLLRGIDPHWLMYGLLLNWVGDIGAYYVGRPFGRHKLAPRVSPKKSWEGSAASVVTSVAIGGAYLWYFMPGIPILNIVLLTAAANVAGQIGDLSESAMKRGAGVKDSGSILPGHGGFLDRVDSSLFAIPLVYGYVTLFG